MPPKRNHLRKNSKAPVAGAGAMADCVLPQEIMLAIVTRLPVKSIYRFKSVCKPWLKLFSTPKFMKLHHAQLSQNPVNQSVVIYSKDVVKHDHTMTLYKLESGEQRPIDIEPYHQMLYGFDFVGSCYGLLCIAYPPLGQLIFVWNTALKVFKNTPLPKLEIGEPEMVSLGFGYDEEADDFKIVRIVSEVKGMKGKKKSVGVEVYSCNSNSWKTIKVGFQFSVLWTKNDAVVNGNPYWVARVKGNCGADLVWFDLKKMALKVVSLNSLSLGGTEQVKVVDWKGHLGALVYNKNDERVLSLDLWVFDNFKKIWIKNQSFGPVELRIDRFLRCLRNGMIVGECSDGKLFGFNTEKGGVREIVVDGAEKQSFQIHEYTQSMAYIKGMEKKKVKTEEEEKKIDEMVDNFFRRYLGLKDGEPVPYGP